MDIINKLEEIRIDSLNKSKLLKNGEIGNSQESIDILKIGLADNYDKLVTISYALKTLISPFST